MTVPAAALDQATSAARRAGWSQHRFARAWPTCRRGHGRAVGTTIAARTVRLTAASSQASPASTQAAPADARRQNPELIEYPGILGHQVKTG